jgi:hypothetical protein
MRFFIKFLAVNCIDHCGENMFDFNSREVEERESFKSNILYLEAPN